MDVMTIVLWVICALLITCALFAISFFENTTVEFYRTTLSKHADAPIYDILCSKKLAFWRVPAFVLADVLVPVLVPHPFNDILKIIIPMIILMYPMFIVIVLSLSWCIREAIKYVWGKLRGESTNKNAYEYVKSDDETVASSRTPMGQCDMTLNDDATKMTVTLPTDADGNQLIRGDIVRYTDASGQECARVINNFVLVMDDYTSTTPDMFGHAHWQLIFGEDNVRASKTHLTTA